MKQLQQWFEWLAGHDALAEQRRQAALQAFARQQGFDNQLALPACWRRAPRIRF